MNYRTRGKLSTKIKSSCASIRFTLKASHQRTEQATVCASFLTSSSRPGVDKSWQFKSCRLSIRWSKSSKRREIWSMCRWWRCRLNSPSSAACRASTLKWQSLKRSWRGLKRNSLTRLWNRLNPLVMLLSCWTLLARWDRVSRTSESQLLTMSSMLVSNWKTAFQLALVFSSPVQSLDTAQNRRFSNTLTEMMMKTSKRCTKTQS